MGPVLRSPSWTLWSPSSFSGLRAFTVLCLQRTLSSLPSAARVFPQHSAPSVTLLCHTLHSGRCLQVQRGQRWRRPASRRAHDTTVLPWRAAVGSGQPSLAQHEGAGAMQMQEPCPVGQTQQTATGACSRMYFLMTEYWQEKKNWAKVPEKPALSLLRRDEGCVLPRGGLSRVSLPLSLSHAHSWSLNDKDGRS